MVALHRLAERLGRTVGELVGTLSAREFAQWVALAEIDAEERPNAPKTAEDASRAQLSQWFQLADAPAKAAA